VVSRISIAWLYRGLALPMRVNRDSKRRARKIPSWTLTTTHSSKYHCVLILPHQQRDARDFFEAKAKWRLVFRALHDVSVALTSRLLPFTGGFAGLKVDHCRLKHKTHNGIVWRARLLSG
jgi:hypothetical protein